MDEVDFLSRLYDVDAMPSRDPRFHTAARDIAQHRIMNDDWDDDWIFFDTRFKLNSDDQMLLRFLCEMLNPYVRSDESEVQRIHMFLNAVLVHDGYEIIQVDAISGAPIFAGHRIGTGVSGAMKNLIFAAIGPKPKIVLDDAINNDARDVENEANCLIYDRPLAAHGLTWNELVAWWIEREGLRGQTERQIWLSLHHRLMKAMNENDAEKRIFTAYARRYATHGGSIAALIPQVYLHYDPYSQRRYVPGTAPFQRQRMDFLLLFAHGHRVVIECDGRQHYADDTGRADPERYAAMVAEDRELRLRGYEVYRFGGWELTDNAATTRRLDDFFDRLHERYSL